jgi:hypothetical protein
MKALSLSICGSALLSLMLTNCAASKGLAKGTRHPEMELRHVQVSRDRLISDAELGGGKQRNGSVGAVGSVAGKVALTAVLIPLGIIEGMAGGPGVVAQANPWGEEGKTSRRTLSDGGCPKIQLSGYEVGCKRTGNNTVLARAVGASRIEVTDQHGSYYCLAREIHYRPLTQEIILRDNIYISRVNGAMLNAAGLARIDLSRCIVEYGGAR